MGHKAYRFGVGDRVATMVPLESNSAMVLYGTVEALSAFINPAKPRNNVVVKLDEPFGQYTTLRTAPENCYPLPKLQDALSMLTVKEKLKEAFMVGYSEGFQAGDHDGYFEPYPDSLEFESPFAVEAFDTWYTNKEESDET